MALEAYRPLGFPEVERFSLKHILKLETLKSTNGKERISLTYSNKFDMTKRLAKKNK
jgi:hypothetical protein